MNLNIAYLVNQYPKVSHSFIRREILGIEACGIQVQKFSIRSCIDELVDQADISEVEKTRVILEHSLFGLLPSLLRNIVQSPFAFLNALHLAWCLGKNSEKGVWYHIVYLAEACVLLGWFKESDVKHVHVHFGTNSTTVAMLCHALGGPPYSFTVHGPEEFDNVHLIALPEKIRRAKFVVAISSFGKSQLYRWTPFEDWSKIHIVRCGVDQSFLSETSSPIPDAPQFVCIGRLTEQKGHVVLLQAAHQLIKEGRSFKLIFVGDGELRPQIEHLIELLDLQSHVEITGWCSGAEVRAHLIQSRALVLPSFAEGLPVVIMEALALGRPVISTYIAGIPELVESGINGWLVPPGSVDALADVMRLALNSSVHELAEMGKIGAERVTKFHNSDIEAYTLANLF
jgi:glycosyltransferase involved in cell wall biosynthesis